MKDEEFNELVDIVRSLTKKVADMEERQEKHITFSSRMFDAVQGLSDYMCNFKVGDKTRRVYYDKEPDKINIKTNIDCRFPKIKV